VLDKTRILEASDLSGKQGLLNQFGQQRSLSSMAGDKGSKCALAALVVFLLLNLVLFKVPGIRFDQFRYPYKSWIWWLIQDLRFTKDRYDLALIGSSLMVSAVTHCDANHLNRTLDMERHHSADYFDSQLRTLLHGNYKTINLATYGQVPSDAYLIIRTILQLGQHPNVLIYGVAPRDFLDSTLSSPSDTEPYRYLSRIIYVEDLIDKLCDTTATQFDHWLNGNLFLCRYALDLQMHFSALAKYFVDDLLPRPHTQHPFTYRDRCQLLPNYNGNEICAGACRIVPLNSKLAGTWAQDNTPYYTLIYHKPSSKIFETQLYFLQKLSELCKEQRVQLILVNMPLSKRNIAWLTKSRYGKFVSTLSGFAHMCGVPFIDLSDPNVYSDQLFHDSAHLNGYGGKVFIDELISKLNSDSRLRSQIIAAGTRAQELVEANRMPVE